MADIHINITVPDSIKMGRKSSIIPYGISEYPQDGDAIMFMPNYNSIVKPEWFSVWPSWGKLNG